MSLKKIVVSLFLVCLFSLQPFAQNSPKREFRGAWIHTVGQDQYAKMSEASMKAYFKSLLDSLRRSGINTVVFQIRPEADAWYKSPYEPWSRYITGVQGKDPGWDPLEFLVTECHKRNMELHAWINPYRVRTSPNKPLAANHLYFKDPSLFIQYGNYLWFDPGNPASRKHIVMVVKDIVKRYDIDAIHMDDYFYPYPMDGLAFNDDSSFQKYGPEMGFKDGQRADWRRENVNLLIKELHEAIHKTKPWVELGISPFGIYRNGHNGSHTNGFTNYDGLYADILHWVQEGWVDYLVPQLYWEIGHRTADYKTLIYWWAANSGNIPLYIGEDVIRTIRPDSLKKGQLRQKMDMAAGIPQVSGHCFWPGYEIKNNAGGIADSLKQNYFRYPALHPADNAYDHIPPKNVRNLAITTVNGKKALAWTAPEASSDKDRAAYYVVYSFKNATNINLDDPSHIVYIGSNRKFALPADTVNKLFVVTAVDRFHNESKGQSIFLR
ncbi:MAG: family 10 glycosylhydrolase [Bacteroidota bacterium]|nr:family 10 glycosylhydrolase [Bacteroidota bacterium]